MNAKPLNLGCTKDGVRSKALRENIPQALLIENTEADVTFNIISIEKAISIGLSGSPSVFVDGKEIQPQGTVGFS